MTDGTPGTANLVRQKARAFELQSALLSLDFCVRDMPTEWGDEADQAAQRVVDAVGIVWEALERLKEQGKGGLAAVPQWLGPLPLTAPDGDPRLAAGLRLLQERLDSGEEVWTRVAERLREGAEGFLLEMVATSWREHLEGQALSASGSYLRASVTYPKPLPEPLPASAERRSDAEGEPLRVELMFPVVHVATGNGFLVELAVRAKHTGLVPNSLTETRVLTAHFRRGLRAGHQAGLTIARQLGVCDQICEEWADIDVDEVRGVPPNYRIDDMSAGLPMAVATVRHLVGLPAAAKLVSGQILPNGEIASVPTRDEFAAKALASRTHGMDLLDVTPGTDLISVCTLIWPEHWLSTAQDLAASALSRREHRIRSLEGVETDIVAPTGKRFDLVWTHVADQIVQRLTAGASAIVVGGPRASARSTSVQQALLKWRGMRGISMVELRLHLGVVPDQAELQRLITLARHATRIPMDDEVIVVLEDLIPHDDPTDLDVVLPEAANATGTTIIAVCLYSGGTRWNTDQVATVPSLVRDEDVQLFCEEFCRLNGLTWLDARHLAVARKAAAGDILLLVSILMETARAPVREDGRDVFALAATATELEAALTVDDMVQADTVGGELDPEAASTAAIRSAYVTRVRGDASREQLNELRSVAACSLLGLGIPEQLLTKPPRALLLQIGAQRDDAGRWYITRSVTCRALLATDEGIRDTSGREWKRTADAQYDALARVLRPHLHAYDPTIMNFATRLLSASNAVEPRLHRRLLGLLTSTLTTNIGVDAPPSLTAHALLAGGRHFQHAERKQLFETLLESILVQGWGSMSARDAATCLRAIRSHREHAADEALRLYREVFGIIGRDLRPVLARSDPVQGVPLVQELGPFFEEFTAREVVSLAVQATNRCDPRRIQHYDATVRLIEAALKYGPDRRAEILKSFLGASGVQRLIEAGTGDDVGLLLARIALEDLLGIRDYADSAFRQLGRAVSTALTSPKSTPASLTRGLLLNARVNAWLGRQVISRSNTSQWLRARVFAEPGLDMTPWQAAKLIRALGSVDARTILAVLYDDDGTPNDAVVDALVQCVITMGDIKAVGHIVPAVASIDTYWGPGGSASCSAQLCARLEGFVDIALNTEIRASVVLVVMSALVDAGISVETLRALLARCADIVAAEAEDNSKDHAPRLALLLGHHEAVGSQFLEMLAERIDDEVLLRRMTGCESVEARALYLSLARALRRTKDPAFIERFVVDEWFQVSLGDLKNGNVLSALKALRSYSLTLRDAGVAFPNTNLLTAVEEDPKRWANRLKLLYHPGQLSEALHLFEALAPAFAIECLQELDALHRPEARFGGTLPATSPFGVSGDHDGDTPIPAEPTPARVAALERRKKDQRHLANRQPRGLVRLVQRQFIDLGQAVEIVHAVHAVDQEAGHAIGTALSADDKWGTRVRGLLDLDSPVHLGNLLRIMAPLSLVVPMPVLEQLFRIWSRQVYEFTSPAVAESVTRGFAASGPRGVEMARQWASGLNVARIARRMSRGLPSDVEKSSILMRTLEVWGPAGSARQIALALPHNAVDLVPLKGASEILRTLEEVELDLARSHAEVAAGVVAAQSQVHYVTDPEQHWRSLGWLIRTTRALIGDGAVDAEVVLGALTPWRLRDEVVSWVEGCIGRAPNDDRWDASTATPLWAKAARVVVLSDLDLVDATVTDGLNTLIEKLSPAWQLELLRCAAQNRQLRQAFTKDDTDYMTELGEWLVRVGRPVGVSLAQAARDLQRS